MAADNASMHIRLLWQIRILQATVAILVARVVPLAWRVFRSPKTIRLESGDRWTEIGPGSLFLRGSAGTIYLTVSDRDTHMSVESGDRQARVGTGSDYATIDLTTADGAVPLVRPGSVWCRAGTPRSSSSTRAVGARCSRPSTSTSRMSSDRTGARSCSRLAPRPRQTRACRRPCQTPLQRNSMNPKEPRILPADMAAQLVRLQQRVQRLEWAYPRVAAGPSRRHRRSHVVSIAAVRVHVHRVMVKF